MNSLDARHAFLLAAQDAGQLTPAEERELARLNSRRQSPLFVSKHVFQSRNLSTHIQQIDWFAHCGEPVQLDLTLEVAQVKSWAKASECSTQPSWDNALLEARNQLTIWLSVNHHRKYQKWNTLSRDHEQKVLQPLVKKTLLPLKKKHRLGKVFIDLITWNIHGALMENSYLSCKHNCFFFHELLMVYEAGHCPCGWRGRWPGGKLIVF